MGTHRVGVLRTDDVADLRMTSSGELVMLAIIALLLGLVIFITVSLSSKAPPNETVEETHRVQDGRTVTCLVIPRTSIDCDWMTAGVRP